MFRWIYWNMARVTGWPVPVVDELEVWEVAMYLGRGSPGPTVPAQRLTFYDDEDG